jgi:hypothetical protein
VRCGGESLLLPPPLGRAFLVHEAGERGGVQRRALCWGTSASSSLFLYSEHPRGGCGEAYVCGGRSFEASQPSPLSHLLFYLLSLPFSTLLPLPLTLAPPCRCCDATSNRHTHAVTAARVSATPPLSRPTPHKPQTQPCRRRILPPDRSSTNLFTAQLLCFLPTSPSRLFLYCYRATAIKTVLFPSVPDCVLFRAVAALLRRTRYAHCPD